MTTFTTPIDNVATTLGSARAAGAGTLAVAAGTGALFGSPTPAAPVRFTVVKAAAFGAQGQITDRSALTIFRATGRTGDTLTGLTVIEGTTDQSFAAGDPVAVWVTAGTIGDLNAAVNTLEAQQATDEATVAAHTANTANPHNVTAVQVGSGTAQWNASKLQNRLLDSAVTPTDGMVLTWVASTSKWTPVAASSGGTPAGASGSVQYNASGSFGATSETWDGANVLTLTGTTPERRLALDGTHYSRETRVSATNTYTRYNKVQKPAGSPYSLSFSGTNYVSVPDAPSFQIGTGSFSVSVWIKTTAAVRVAVVGKFDPAAAGGAGSGWFLDMMGTGNIRFGFAGSATFLLRDSAGAVNDGAWHHVLGVYGGTFSTPPDVYVDGVLSNGAVNSAGVFASFDNAAALKIAGLNDARFEASLPGKVDDPRVWIGRALSASDAATLAGGGDPSATGLVMHLPFNEGTGTTAADTSGLANGGTLVSSPAWSTDVPAANPSPPAGALVEAQVVQSVDGIAAGEAGRHRFGDPAGHTTIQAGTGIALKMGTSSAAEVDSGGNLSLFYGLVLAQLAFAAAPNGSLFLDASNSNHLTYKDLTGTGHVLA